MLLLGNTRERKPWMVNDSSAGLTGLVLLAIYGYGYLMPGTGMSMQLARNVARGEAARFDELRSGGRELELARLARTDHAAEIAAPYPEEPPDLARF